MEQTISYVMVTPYTVAKSRTGGVLARLLSRLDLELVGAQMIAPDEEFAKTYANQLRNQRDHKNPEGAELLANYVEKNLVPSGGRRHRTLLLLFRGEEPCRKLSDICGALYSENRSIESITGETIRDTYADLMTDPNDPKKITYFEPAVLTPRNQELADDNLKLFARFLPEQPNIVENMVYPEPSKIQQTLVIIKPDNWMYASSKPGTIIDMFSRTGLRIIGIKVHRFSLAEALEFYGPVEDTLCNKLAPVFGQKAKEILNREFNMVLSDKTEKALAGSFGIEYAENQFRQIVEFMSGLNPLTVPVEERNNPGPVKCMILIYEGEDAVKKIRDVLGPTDPLKAPGGTVRREFGSNVMVNTAHASDSPESVIREKGIVRIEENSLLDIINSYLSMRN
ncbi:nucleoside-diphosphate kinase [Breznakiella homolactica]|uniref:Nucleoside diphosphate kinase n=1 Tax=Breznakiella homolactica TaxID=2798577 RepID=A0A7T7XR63_9SPIR|nr:nucleoside-diphosphate kinase [Breznakiella homolactica]QQO10958.1 nucleoside-diphosphate kinase [Breznakiella homolactica]